MEKATYRRIQGQRHTYQIRYDHAGYEVSRDGQLKKIGVVSKSLDQSILSRREKLNQGLFSAELAIEALIGMDE